MANDIVLGSELGLEFDIGVEVSNKISVKVDGTSIVKDGTTGSLAAANPVYDSVAKTITYPAVNGVAGQVIDLSEFVVDVFVDGATFNATTNVLTLTDNSGTTPDVVVDLSNLLGVSSDAGNLLTNGADGKPLFDKAALNSQTQICTSVFGTNLFRGVTI